MQGLRILVVDDHKPMRKCLIEFLQKQEGIGQIKEAANGVEALERLAAEPFDVMITDVIMPVMDGYTLLDEMKRVRLAAAPKTIVISALSRDDFVMRAIELGAGFYMVKPFEMQHLIHHIMELCGGRANAPQVNLPMENKKEHTMEERLGNLFLTMGIPAHIKGYQFLRYAVRMVVDQPDVINRITKELYPGIAKHYGTSASKVERAIRHAIEVAWNRGRIDTINTTFGCKVCTPEDKPTNGEFIAMLADKLSLEKTA